MDMNPFRMTIDVPAQSRAGVLCVRISGDVDLSDNWDLSLATPRIRETGANTVYIDVGPVTFFGTTVVNFIVHLLNAGPGSRIVVCRPSAMARRVVAALPLPAQISIRPDLPPDWVEPPITPRSLDRRRVAS
jgi:anti-anti-sigma regulatory factor